MTIRSELRSELLKQARDSVEACGVLWGEHQGEVLDFSGYPGPLFPHHFRISDSWLLGQCYQRRVIGQRAIGFYHFHPDSKPAEPSARDVLGHPFGSAALVLSSVDDSMRAFRRLAEPARFEEIYLEQE